ncbi:hypothetical protein NC651_037051 [Populus alba x Populus x berolinensis]|nr:hypothetical protein NC651_037051 [Populus alba x Populus x berolinensis]
MDDDEPAIEAKDLVNSYVVALEDEGEECCVVEDAETPMVLDDGNRFDTVNVELFQCLNGMVEEPALGMGFTSEDDVRDFYKSFVVLKKGFTERSEQRKWIQVRKQGGGMLGLLREKDYDPNNSFSESLSSPVMGLDAPVIVFTEDGNTVGKMVFNFLNCINYVGRGRLSNFGIDAQNILEFFKIMQASDPAFYHAVQVDEEDRPSSVFWVDTRSRIAYDYFSDVVAFDTTYQANQCMVPSAPFTGMNTAQKSGSVNLLFDGYVNARTTLQDFAEQYVRALDDRYEKEAKAELETVYTKPIIKTPLPMEKQAAEVYTRKLFCSSG